MVDVSHDGNVPNVLANLLRIRHCLRRRAHRTARRRGPQRRHRQRRLRPSKHSQGRGAAPAATQCRSKRSHERTRGRSAAARRRGSGWRCRRSHVQERSTAVHSRRYMSCSRRCTLRRARAVAALVTPAGGCCCHGRTAVSRRIFEPAPAENVTHVVHVSHPEMKSR